MSVDEMRQNSRSWTFTDIGIEAHRDYVDPREFRFAVSKEISRPIPGARRRRGGKANLD